MPNNLAAYFCRYLFDRFSWKIGPFEKAERTQEIATSKRRPTQNLACRRTPSAPLLHYITTASVAGRRPASGLCFLLRRSAQAIMTAYHLLTALVPALAYQLQFDQNTLFHFVSKSSHRKLSCVIQNTLFEKGIFRTMHSFLDWSCSSLGNNAIVRICFFLQFRRGSHLFLLCLFQTWSRHLVNLHLLFLIACRF